MNPNYDGSSIYPNNSVDVESYKAIFRQKLADGFTVQAIKEELETQLMIDMALQDREQKISNYIEAVHTHPQYVMCCNILQSVVLEQAQGSQNLETFDNGHQKVC